MAIHVPRLFVKAPPTETDWIAAALRASQRQVLTVFARRHRRRGNPEVLIKKTYFSGLDCFVVNSSQRQEPSVFARRRSRRGNPENSKKPIFLC